MSLENVTKAARNAFDAMVQEMAAELRRKDEEMFRSERRRNELEAEGLAKDKEIEALNKKIAELETTIRDCNGQVKTMEKKVERKAKYLKEQAKKFNDYHAKIQQSMAALMEADPTSLISMSFDETVTSDGSGDDDSEEETTTGSRDDTSKDVGEPSSPFGSKISAESTGRETRMFRRNLNRTEPSIPSTMKVTLRSARGGPDKQPDVEKK